MKNLINISCGGRRTPTVDSIPLIGCLCHRPDDLGLDTQALVVLCIEQVQTWSSPLVEQTGN